MLVEGEVGEGMIGVFKRDDDAKQDVYNIHGVRFMFVIKPDFSPLVVVRFEGQQRQQNVHAA